MHALEADPRRPISGLAAELGVSHGHLDREFTEIVGLGPRVVSRILRLRALLAAIDVYAPVDWPGLAAAWMSGVESIRVSGPELTFRARGRDRTGRVEVVEPGRTVVVHSAQGGVTAAYTYTCEPDGGRTLVTLTADCRVTGAWRPFAGLLRAAIRHADGGQINAFKRVAEGR